ncbi:MAG: rhodanese domain-containing protein [Candidatus Thermoplasmatota archaeon]|nr:rhodanese domain-containing protein [Candidatus Thermoplasmatota archaeon]
MIVNIAGYRFVDLPDRDELHQPMLDFCMEAGLKGTVLLSPNGINFFLAGTEQSTGSFLSHLELDERLAGIPVKVSHTDYQPFRRMLVKRKREIISLGMDDIRPAEFTGPHISPKEFKQMLAGGEDVVVLDARNDYETRVGMFDGAVDLDIASFREFPGAIEELPDDYRSKTVVMYCTGGIRCEKASAVMLKAGFEDVRQLEGGILGYFEECGGTYWNGDCFVFDQRVALDHQLEETEIVMCFKCREPLSAEEQESENYVIGQHCPYCYSNR